MEDKMEWEKELKEIKDNSALWKLLWRVWEASDLIKRRYQIDAFDRGLMNDLIEHLNGPIKSKVKSKNVFLICNK